MKRWARPWTRREVVSVHVVVVGCIVAIVGIATAPPPRPRRRLEDVTPAPTPAPTQKAFSESLVQALTELVVQMCVVLAMGYILRLLLEMAHANSEREPPYKLKKDPFFDAPSQGWNWDFVMFLGVKDEIDLADEDDDEYARKNTLKKIVAALNKAGLETRQYKGRKLDKVIVKIRATAQRLKEQADFIDMKVRLNGAEVRRRIQDGLPDKAHPGEYRIYPRRNDWSYRGVPQRTAIQDTEEQCPYAYYEHMYGKFDAKLESLYYKSPPFRGCDRIKLIMSIFGTQVNDNGAGLQLETLLSRKLVLAAFPLHDFSELRQLERKWLVYWQWPWKQPVNRVKDYFGEKIGFYFLFLGHYTTFLTYSSLVGVGVYIHTLLDPRMQNAESVPYFCVFMSLWATVFLEFWKRKQARYAMLWGMVGFEEEEGERPEFAQDEATVSINSPIDGEPEYYFPPELAARRYMVSTAAISTCIAAVCAVVYSIFLLNVILRRIDDRLDPRFFLSHRLPSIKLRGTIIGVANTAQIMVLESLYSAFARYLNDREGHRSETKYEDALIGKTFIFTFVNAYASFIYTAFIKRIQATVQGAAFPPPTDRLPRLFDCVDQNCMADLQTQLSSIFVSRVLISNIRSVVIPYYFWAVAQRKRRDKERAEDFRKAREAKRRLEQQQGEDANDDEEPLDDDNNKATAAASKALAERTLSPAEIEEKLDEYHVMLGPFADYAELVTILGFAVLFVGAFPLAPLMALVNSYVEIRVDAWRIAQCSRRPWPAGAEDIGTWNDIIELMSYFAVVINGLIITYTGDFLVNRSIIDRFAIFIAYCHALFFFKFVIAILIDDVPSDVQIQIDRQRFIESKLITKLQDPNIDIFDEDDESKGVDLTIYDEDDDQVYLDIPGYEKYRETRMKSMALALENAKGRPGRRATSSLSTGGVDFRHHYLEGKDENFHKYHEADDNFFA